MAASSFIEPRHSNEKNISSSECEDDEVSDWIPSNSESDEESVNEEHGDRDEVMASPSGHEVTTNPEASNTEAITRGRTRVRHPEEWIKNKRKRLRNSGKEYISVVKKVVKEKAIEDVNCNCKLNCYTNVPFHKRKCMFETFYKLGNWTTQRGFLQGLVKQHDVKRRDTRDRSKRFGKQQGQRQASRPKNTTRKYFVKLDGNDVQVCKPFFLATFKVSNGTIDRALQTLKKTGCPQNDQRGRHTPANKTPPENVAYMKSFIDKLPVYESHYTRQHNINRKYFAPGLTLAKLYSLYKEDCIQNNVIALSDWKFRDYFNKEYSISFHTPLKDTCKTCDSLTVQIDASVKSADEAKEAELKTTREVHHRKAEAAQKKYKEDVAKVANNEDVTVFCYDLQKTLPVPVLTTGIVYYKRQMWVYNLGIHDAKTSNGFMYVWNETEGSRGPDEIASCVYKHLSKQSTSPHVIAYADTCGGQNRNIKMAVFWLHIVGSSTNNINLVDQKYFVSGHSWMDCDKDFGYIEKAKQRFPEVFIPDKWIDVIKGAKSKKPFEVTKMKPEDLLSMAKLEKAIVNRKVDIEGNKVEWLKMHWLQFRKECPKKIFFKYGHTEDVEFRCIDVSRIGGAVAQRNISVGQVKLQTLYPNGRKIALPKYNDLQDLLPYIPPVNHDFYKNLKTDKDAVEGELVDPEFETADP